MPHMLCPYGHDKGARVIDSRLVRDGRAVRRRRQCAVCKTRFTTYEETQMRLMVAKRDGVRQPYQRDKLRAGVARALEKRPQERNLDQIVDAIEHELFATVRGADPVGSRDIGKVVLEHLKSVDEVAYLRFASVYKGFGSAASFRKELDRL